MIQLPTEFSELLRSFHAHEVRYLVVGGYAVAYHGYPRTTGDIDLWVEQHEDNAHRIVAALRAFGFALPGLHPTLFLNPDRIVRMGYPPLRVEIMMDISGVAFAHCYARRIKDTSGEFPIYYIDLDCLKTNKRASGRHKDLSDLENLP